MIIIFYQLGFQSTHIEYTKKLSKNKTHIENPILIEYLKFTNYGGLPMCIYLTVK